MAATPRIRGHAAPDRRVRPRRVRDAWSSCIALVLIGAVLAGCATVPGPAPSATALPAGITAELVQLRSDVAGRQAQVHVHNGTKEELVLGDVRVVDPRFVRAAMRPTDRESRVPAGHTVDIRIQLPAVDCEAPDAATSTLVADFAIGEAVSVVATPLPESVPFLADLHARECRAEALSAAASLAFSDFTPSAPGAPADLVLEIRPTGEAAATIDAIRTTNLLTFGAGVAVEEYPIAVDVTAADDAPIAVHLPLVPLRCDPHAVQEDKRGTIFTLEVTVDGVRGDIELAADEDLRGRLLTWVSQWCGFGG